MMVKEVVEASIALRAQVTNAFYSLSTRKQVRSESLLSESIPLEESKVEKSASRQLKGAETCACLDFAIAELDTSAFIWQNANAILRRNQYTFLSDTARIQPGRFSPATIIAGRQW